MTDNRQNLRSAVRAAITLTVAAAAYEALARSGYFAPALLPTLANVARALFASLADGSMIVHAAFTLYRVLFGFCLAVVSASARHPDGAVSARRAFSCRW
jgi:NitT/TauT family transport system permease protein